MSLAICTGAFNISGMHVDRGALATGVHICKAHGTSLWHPAFKRFSNTAVCMPSCGESAPAHGVLSTQRTSDPSNQSNVATE